MNAPSMVRAGVLREVAERIPRPDALGRTVVVGVDGVDGSGKTTFADELADVLRPHTPTARVSIDEFHHPKYVRYRRGADSPEGFWLDSYDYDAFRRLVVEPLRAGLNSFIAAAHDVDTDQALDGPRVELGGPGIVLVDGIFVHRDELRSLWDFSVFLDVSFKVSYARMAERDGCDLDPFAPSNRRYLEGQRIYMRECDPASRASVVVNNDDVDAPSIVGT